MYKGISKFISRARNIRSHEDKNKRDKESNSEGKKRVCSNNLKIEQVTAATRFKAIFSPLAKMDFKRCEQCNARVRVARLEKHMKKMHGNEVVAVNNNARRIIVVSRQNKFAEQKQINASERFPVSDNVSCPVCGISVARNILSLHQTTPYCMRWLEPLEMLYQ